MKKYAITQLPSGNWCVWFDGEWINAALPSREAAEDFIKDHARRTKGGKAND